MKDPMNLNADLHVVAIDNTSKKATLKATHPEGSSIIISNNSTNAVFVMSSPDSAATAVFPTSADTPVLGQVILPGAAMSFGYNPSERYIYAIQATAGTGDLYISAGGGV